MREQSLRDDLMHGLDLVLFVRERLLELGDHRVLGLRRHRRLCCRRPRLRILARLAHAVGHVALVIKRLARVRRSVRLQRFPHGAQHQRLPRARADLDVSTTG